MLTVLVSQLPALGIRIFMIPHVIKNDIIAKTTTDLIQCRISVMGSPDHIESTTGTKPREFNIRLSNVGDMAVKIPTVQAHTFFSHGAAITDSNVENNNFFDYLTKLWNKLDGIEPKSETTVTNENHIQIHSDSPIMNSTVDSYNPLEDDDIEFDFKSSIL
jgi:S-DNA-T family DNA segregation ATPase FtsK/SpoIIIE